MKTITIELTDSEHQDISKNAEEALMKLEDYIVVTARLYKGTYETGLIIYKEKEEERINNEYLKHKVIVYTEKNKKLEEEIKTRNDVIDKYEDILQGYYEKVGDLDKI